MNEQDIQRKITKWLEKEGAYVVKVIQANRAGVADILCCWKGQFVAIEVKTPRGRVAPLQEYHASLVVKAGGVSMVARSLDDVREFLSGCQSSRSH
jgi:Holliday junction resolvase